MSPSPPFRFSNPEVAPIPDHTEIERRFLVDGRGEKPWRTAAIAQAIEQYYGVGKHLRHSEGTMTCNGVLVAWMTAEQAEVYRQTSDWVTRLRKQDNAWFLTFKSRISSMAARELEWRLEPEAAQTLLAQGPFPSVEKTRYMWIGDDEAVWEVDEFEGGLAGLVLAEVELERSDQSVMLPAWLGQEITGLSSWSNRALAETLASTL